MVATIVQEEQECVRRGRWRMEMGHGALVVEEGEGGAGASEDGWSGAERWRSGEAGDGVGAMVGVGVGVLPGVDEEAVEAAESGEEKCGGEQGEAEVGAAGDGGDEGGGGEEEADGDLFGEAVGGRAWWRG